LRPSRTLSRFSFPSLPFRLFVFLLAAGCLLPGTGPGVKAGERIQAVQIILLEGESVEDLRPSLRNWKKAGFDTVVLRAFHLPGDRPHGPVADSAAKTSQGVYFPTGLAPLVADLFTPFVSLCREEGIRPFAWMVTRQAGFGREDLPRDAVLDPATRQIRQGDSLDILDETVCTYLEGLFSDLAATGVEGILLQDDLALRMTEGFSTSALARYREETGDPVPPQLYLSVQDGEERRSIMARSDFDRWTRWKTSNMASFGRRLERAAQKTRPGTVVVMNLMYEALTDPENGRLWLSQDLEVSLRSGPSRAAVMLYHRQMQEELGLPFPDVLRQVREALERVGSSVHQPRVVLKFQTRDWNTSETVPREDLLATLMTAWDGKWSVAFVPPPTEEQLRAMEFFLEKFETGR